MKLLPSKPADVVRLAFAVLGAVLSVASAGSASADESATRASSRIDADATAYCAWVRSVATSQSSTLLAPTLFASGGVVGGAEGGEGTTALPPTPRLTAGASYSVANLVRGVAVGDRADADCALYRSEAILRAFVQAFRDGESKAALAASLAVYEAAEPRGKELVERSRVAAAAGRATTLELTEIELRLDDLRARLQTAKRQRDSLAKRVLPSAKDLATALAGQPAREADVERELARIRTTSAWDLSLRGGYDRFFGVREHVPLFGVATLSVNLGLLFQPAANRRAVDARQDWARSQVDGPTDRATQVTTRLAAIRVEARERHQATGALEAELDQRMKTLEAVSTDGARVAATTVWFALVHARAQRAFYGTLIIELDEALRGVT